RLSRLRVVDPLLEELRVVREVVVLLAGDVRQVGSNRAARIGQRVYGVAPGAAPGLEHLLPGSSVALLEGLGPGIDADDTGTGRAWSGIGDGAPGADRRGRGSFSKVGGQCRLLRHQIPLPRLEELHQVVDVDVAQGAAESVGP